MPYCQLPDADLYFELQGDGPPLLFLHGLGSSSRDWEHQVDHFSKKYQVLTLDMRGHGRSSKIKRRYSIPLLARDVSLFMDELELPPVHITGLSMGGMVALQLALDHPEKVRTIAAVNCEVDYSLNSARRWAVYLTRLLIVAVFGPYALGHYLSRRLLPDPDHKEMRKAFIRRYRRNSRRTLLACINAIAGWSIRDRLHEIQHPALIVAAEHDYSSVTEKLAWAPQIPQARFTVIPHTHHAVPVEKPWNFNTHLESFLKYYQETWEGVFLDAPYTSAMTTAHNPQAE